MTNQGFYTPSGNRIIPGAPCERRYQPCGRPADFWMETWQDSGRVEYVISYYCVDHIRQYYEMDPDVSVVGWLPKDFHPTARILTDGDGPEDDEELYELIGLHGYRSHDEPYDESDLDRQLRETDVDDGHTEDLVT